jgi:predicted RNase H-like HicB family nuclease
MERLLKLHIEKLPEGVYLATTDDLPGLVAQGRTITETLEIARDVARKLIEAQTERGQSIESLQPITDRFDYELVIGALVVRGKTSRISLSASYQEIKSFGI